MIGSFSSDSPNRLSIEIPGRPSANIGRTVPLLLFAAMHTERSTELNREFSCAAMEFPGMSKPDEIAIRKLRS
jgi:hypothetical protein